MRKNLPRQSMQTIQLRSIFLLIVAPFLLLFQPSSFAQNGLIGSGFGPGWSNPSNIVYFGASAGNSRIATRNPGGTGNQYFRMVRAWSGNNSEFSPSASCCGGCDAAVGAFDTEIFAANTSCTNGAWYINCANTTDNYVFKTPNGASGTSFVVFKIQGAVRIVSSVAQAPLASSVAVSQPVTVNATLDGALSTGQAVYLRYTTNAYSTSTVVQLTGSGLSYSATIPGFASGTNVSYYLFTSGASNVSGTGSNADLYTINLNNNGGSNYTYTVSNLYLSNATGNYNTGSTWLGSVVPPSGAAIQILNTHNVTLNINATVSAITINTGGTFTGSDGSARSLTISNGVSGTTLNKSGTWANGTGGNTLIFSGAATHTIAGTSSFQHVIANTGINFGTTSTITGNFQMNFGGFVSTNAPIYGSSSSLIYNTTGTYGRGLEWSATSGAGYPNHVQISNSTTLNLGNGATGTARACAGNLVIDDGSTLSMNVGGSVMTAALTVNGNVTLGSSGTAILVLSGSVGGDILVKGNWTRNSSSIFTTNNRQITFGGSALQTITGQTTFDYFRINNSSGLSLASPITINQQLDLSLGKITLGSNSITMGNSSSIVNASTTSYVITNGAGQLLQYVTGSVKEFPIGTSSTIYSPARLTQNGTADVIGIRVEGAPTFIQTPNDINKMVNLEWVLNENTAGGNSLITEFEWKPVNEAGSFVRANGVFHADWNGSSFNIRNATVAGSDPYTSTSTIDYTGNLSNQLFLMGNINGITSCLTSVAAGDWNTTSTWSGGIIPPAGSTVCLNHAITVSAVDPSGIFAVTLNSGSSLSIASGRTFTISNNGSILNNSGASTNLGSGTVNLLGAATLSGSPITITNMTVRGLLMTSASVTLNGILTVKSGAFFNSGINYGSSSTLYYSVSGSRNVANEWYVNAITAGGGVPNNVVIDNTSTINLPMFSIGMAGNLDIQGTLNLNATSGNLTVAGNWTRQSAGVFNPNNRAIIFKGSSVSTVAVVGGGTETFNYLIVDKSGSSVNLSSSPATNITLNASTGNVLEIRSNSTLDLNGQTCNMSGTSGNINSSASIANIAGGSGSTFAIYNGTKTVTASGGGTLVFGSNVKIALTTGIDFGNYLSTINGTFQIGLGGFVTGNAPTYGTGSILRYFSGTSYGRGLEWSATTGPGYPYNVTIDPNGTNTTLDLQNGSSALRKTAGNLLVNDGGAIAMNTMTDAMDIGGNVTIGNGSTGSIILSTSVGGDLIVRGNLTLNSGATLNQNFREVHFNGVTNQTINGVTYFDYLRINNSGTSPNNKVILSSNLDVYYRLYLYNGLLDLNGNQITMADLSKIRRANSSATMSSAATISGGHTIDIHYDGTMTTNVEYPTSAAFVRDLIIDSGTLTLNANYGLNRHLMLSGDLNLDTYTLSLIGRNASPGVSGEIQILTGSRSVTGNTGATFDVVGIYGNNPVEFTKTVTNPGSGTLTFGSNVLVAIGDGRMDFGSGNPVTINGTMQVKLGGSVYPNSCYYGINSLLRFANTVDYGVPSTDYTWAAGSISSGLPGIPWNVEINDGGTDLQLFDTRSLRGNLTITNGTFTLMPAFTGSFNLGGNWTRTGATSDFIHNNKKVIFDRQSAGNQTITVGATVTAESFYDLEFSPVNGNVVLGTSSDVEVTNSLTFVTGKLDLSSSGNTITLGTTSSNGTISGYGATAYIISNGGLFKRFTNTNSTYVYPLGDASNYTPLDLTLSNGAQSSSFVTCKVTAATHVNMGTSTNYISRFWSLEPTGLASSPVYDVTYTYAASDVVGPASNLYPTKYSSLGWIASPGSSANAIDGTSANHNVGTRTFSWGGITTFSDFTGAGDGSPLPVELLSFTADVAPLNTVQLKWITASETNNSHFIVEKSQNAVDYTFVGRIQGSGTSSLMHSYNLIDSNPFEGTSYYRLTQTDYNGVTESFDPIAVNISRTSSLVNIYPNPSSYASTAEISSTVNQSADLQLIDMEGRIVYRFKADLVKGLNKVLVPTSGIPQGNYILSISTTKGQREHLPLIIQK
jgi:hypothetical protein